MVTVLANTHRGEVAKDIVDAILKTRASDENPATYWDQDKQEELLVSAFQKWAEKANVWSAAAEKVSMPDSPRNATVSLTTRYTGPPRSAQPCPMRVLG